MTDDAFVTIARTEYESLLDDRDWRCAMEDGGVDNWVGYAIAMSEYREITESGAK